ncbi:hypothetical protein [Embleya sp. MST-111070]|uniref:hypothetical protein n=1 Tax=Embleya sp. MST-111070 TaxID=3398231 RepID=UPI003F7319A2
MRRARAAALPIVRPDLVEYYLAHRAAQGMNTDRKVRWGARALLATVPDLADFAGLPLERRLAFNHETRRFISWLAVTGRLQPGADYLVARRPRLGIVLARTDPELHLRFMETARSLGFRDTVAMTQFNLLAHFVALFGRQPHELRQADWDQGRHLLLEAALRIPNRGVKALSTALFNLRRRCSTAACPTSCREGARRTGPTYGPRSGPASRPHWRGACSTTCSRSAARCGREP